MIYDINKNLYFGIEGVLNLSNTSVDRNSYKQYSYLPDELQKLGKK
jgi:hypothetical protein